MAVTAIYNGPYTKGYLQYIDATTYHTLVAVPGNIYTITIASGWEVLAPLPADGTWASSSQSPAGFSSVPGIAIPGAFVPGSAGAGQQDAGTLDASFLPDGGEENEWADQVMRAADDPIYREIRERLIQAGEKLAVLRRGQRP